MSEPVRCGEHAEPRRRSGADGQDLHTLRCQCEARSYGHTSGVAPFRVANLTNNRTLADPGLLCNKFPDGAICDQPGREFHSPTIVQGSGSSTNKKGPQAPQTIRN